jgi:hypothetical protein
MSLTIDMTWTPLLEDYLSTALPSPNKIGLRWRGSDRMQDTDVLNMLATFCLAACVGLATTWRGLSSETMSGGGEVDGKYSFNNEYADSPRWKLMIPMWLDQTLIVDVHVFVSLFTVLDWSFRFEDETEVHLWLEPSTPAHERHSVLEVFVFE